MARKVILTIEPRARNELINWMARAALRSPKGEIVLTAGEHGLKATGEHIEELDLEGVEE